MIFASQQGLRFSEHSDHWYADGTFKVCPELFFKFTLFMVSVMGRFSPACMHCFPTKPSNIQTIFLKLFNVENGDANNPNDILVDFENTAIKALRAQKPGIEVKGCFFHLCSNIWKHIQNLGLSIHYKDDEEFALHLRMISALAFLPPADVGVEFVIFYPYLIRIKTKYLVVSN